MLKMIKMYDEIFKLMKLIDWKWEEIIARKESEIVLGSFVIRKEKSKWDEHHEYWQVSIEKPIGYSDRYLNIINFYSRGDHSEIPHNLSKFDAIVISKFEDTIDIAGDEYLGQDEFEECTIPYDRTCSPVERKFSIDLAYEKAPVREILHRMVDFQHMDLKHIDLFSYEFELFVVLAGGFVYNELTSRPFFKVGVPK